jgi:hypothetical protein
MQRQYARGRWRFKNFAAIVASARKTEIPVSRAHGSARPGLLDSVLLLIAPSSLFAAVSDLGAAMLAISEIKVSLY